MTDVDLTRLLTIRDVRRVARARLSRMAFDYYRSGADEGRTLRANVRAYARYAIWYRVLVDVAERDLRTTVLGTPVSMPILVAPTAYHRLAHPDGECATARAAANAQTVFTLSTLSTTSIEDVAAASTGPRWFQLYVHRDRGLTHALVQRAEASGYRAIVLTVDAPLLGRRIADVRNGFALPNGMTMANFTTANETGEQVANASALARYIATRHDAALQWEDLSWLRSITTLPLVIKGLVRPDDAVRATVAGADAIIVSNHGGRQLDGAPATLDALPWVRDAVEGRCELLLDGGIRWGTDVLKALALGARAVLVGRPILWGLAVGGEQGVARVLEILREELSTAMALAGCARIDAIDRDLVRRAGKGWATP